MTNSGASFMPAERGVAMNRSLAEWLELLEARHPTTIELGLGRVQTVRERMGLQLSFPLITVGGTNGKGSTCALLEAMLLANGYQVACHTSPHLLKFNERAKFNGVMLEDALLVRAFEQVEAARCAAPEISLTYFEFTLLGIVRALIDLQPEALILEVGLGGRLDAVNIFDADVAVVTSIDIDHVAYLGDTREKIGLEKAHIYRPGRVAICADPAPPQSLLGYAASIGAQLKCIARDFGYAGDKQQWSFWYGQLPQQVKRRNLAYPALRGTNQLLNASAALAALAALAARLPLSMQGIRQGLGLVELPGRFQVLAGRPTVILDVAHNPHAAGVLSENLHSSGYAPCTYAVFGVLNDKDIAGVVARLSSQVDVWLLATLGGPRGTTAEALRAIVKTTLPKARCETFDTPALAYAAALERASEADRIVVFGSFHTVADVMAVKSPARPSEPPSAK